MIGDLVQRMETFDNSLMKLNKTFKFSFVVKPSTSRDFRYKPGACVSAGDGADPTVRKNLRGTQETTTGTEVRLAHKYAIYRRSLSLGFFFRMKAILMRASCLRTMRQM